MNIWQDRSWYPMLLKEISEPFNSNEYIFEIKFDGIRACIFANKNKLQIISRNNNDITNIYPELQEIKKLVNKDTIIDGEIVIMTKSGPSFEKLQERSHLKNKDKILSLSKINPVVFIAFDILYLDKDLRELSLEKRKNILNKFKENDVFIKSKVYDNGIKLFQNIKKLKLEGIVAKKLQSKYLVNTRSDNWIKIKNFKEGEFIIGGYKEKKNGLSALLGEIKNNKLYFISNVGVTKNLKLYNEILAIKKLTKSPFENYTNDEDIYIKPSLKCIVKYMEKTKTNHLRQPVIKRDEL